MTNLTPMMRQYFEIKERHKDCILFYRLGDFYEMFFEDAITCSKELEIALTSRNHGKSDKTPMCGVPYHAVDGYLNKLIEKGYKVAICEQVEDPKTAKGIVKRDVVRIVSPGTNLNTQALDEGKNNYLMAIIHTADLYGVSIIDITTGDYFLTETQDNSKLIDEIYKWSPSEIICNETFLVSGTNIDYIIEKNNIHLTSLEPRFYDDRQCINIIKKHFKVASLEGLGLSKYTIGNIAAGSVLLYLYETQKVSLSHIINIKAYEYNNFMLIDHSTFRNLELVETLRDKHKKGSLLWVLDKCKTAMGARLLRNFIEQPLIDKKQICDRYNAIENLKDSIITREEIREYLSSIYDLERLMGKVSYNNISPRDLISFSASLLMLPHIKTLLQEFNDGLLFDLFNELDTLEDINLLISSSIKEDPPISVKEGGIIKEGFNKEIDKLKEAKTEGKTWLLNLEEKEKKNTGIKNLKIKYNKIFGYHFEVTNSYKNLVPSSWVRRQTLANAERYSTQELKEIEDLILGAQEKLYILEYEVFCDIRDKIALEVERILKTSKIIAKIDVFASLAYVAEKNNYIKPTLNNNGIIHIKSGRHPVIEKVIDYDMFVANDTLLDNKDNRLSIITGPNMAGKSTYMRQTALIMLMAQMGSFVPAKSADLCIVDRIFTRVGASDDLASGQSTFMVEMTEVSNILRNASKNSLLILDEIGRGTSTFDGLSIAWAVIEHISDIKKLGAKTLFSTHYHELTELEGMIDGVNNYCIAVKEQGEDIIFLRKIIKGGADKSYGIQVAKLAGIPSDVLKRANEISSKLSKHDIAIQAKDKIESKDNFKEVQLSLFSYHDDILIDIRNMDINKLTPIDALNTLNDLQNKIKKRI